MKRIISIFIFVTVLWVTFSSVEAQTNVSLVLGNPSNATADQNNSDNYLVVHSSFVLSYNKSRGGPNWVAWHLAKSDIGTIDRTNAFAPDTSLPRDWWIRPTELSLKGYDRGHLCPSEERSDTEENNRETFLMSNMVPQTARLNRGSWKSLESYIQKLIVRTGDEAYIYAGCYGDKGRIKDKITIPTNCYKIAAILPDGNNDLRRINKNTRVIAVDMPNTTDNKRGWRNYITTVDDLEEKTGYDFLSSLSESLQTILENSKDE
jgi:endonuclease G, mitochondrial